MNRAGLIRLIKTGQRSMGWPDDLYRAWLARHTGHRSTTECSNAQLSQLANELRSLGFQEPGSANRGGSGPGRPSRAQLGRATKLAKALGFSGIDDSDLAGFMRKVAKVDSPRFLDRCGASALILGLEKWLEHKATRDAR